MRRPWWTLPPPLFQAGAAATLCSPIQPCSALYDPRVGRGPRLSGLMAVYESSKETRRNFH